MVSVEVILEEVKQDKKKPEISEFTSVGQKVRSDEVMNPY